MLLSVGLPKLLRCPIADVGQRRSLERTRCLSVFVGFYEKVCSDADAHPPACSSVYCLQVSLAGARLLDDGCSSGLQGCALLKFTLASISGCSNFGPLVMAAVSLACKGSLSIGQANTEVIYRRLKSLIAVCYCIPSPRCWCWRICSD